VDQRTFATRWADTSNHSWLTLIQQHIGDVIWYSFSLKPEIARARHEVVGCDVRLLRTSALHRGLWRMFYMPRPAWRWRRAYPVYATVASYASLATSRLIQALKQDRPQALFVQDYATGRFDTLVWLARRLRIPLVAYHTGSQPEKYTGRLAKRWTLPRANRLIVSSGDELEMLATRFKVPRDRLRLILTPIDTSVFTPLDRTSSCRSSELDPSRRYLLFIGRFDDKVKRISSLIRAFGGLTDVHKDVDLVIVGGGKDAEELHRTAGESAPGRVIFREWTSDKEGLARLYNSAECLVLPSIKEGFPTVVGEAMACGTPVVGSKVGGIPELVTNESTGWLVSPGDIGDLTNRLAHVMSHPDATRAMRERARQVAMERVSPAVVVAGLRECFSDLLEEEVPEGGKREPTR
ncbi:MAG: glycosyltransferase family 4 protein, partial [Actinomycetota bacterium]